MYDLEYIYERLQEATQFAIIEGDFQPLARWLSELKFYVEEITEIGDDDLFDGQGSETSLID